MLAGHPVVDADAHKCENPVVFLDYVERRFRERIGFVRDRFGEQRIRIVDRDARGERQVRVFLQPEGYGKGTFRPYHPETTIGGLFNRVRLQHMDREGIDHQVVYGSVALAFGSLMDPELAAALCRGYNDYISEDCAGGAGRLHPIGVLPLQDPAESLQELERCVLELDMPGVMLPPNLPIPHPAAPDAFPDVRVPKHLSHPDFAALLSALERLDVPLCLHGAPGFQLAGGTSDQLDSFTLVHVFANRSMQQMALARLIFDGTLDAYPSLRVGLLEAGCGWLPDFLHNLTEHWEKRVARFDPGIEPSTAEFLLELARERSGDGAIHLGRKARGLLQLLFSESAAQVGPEELRAFRYEHPLLERDPAEFVARGQVFLTFEPDDPGPAWLPAALGAAGERVCGIATDYGHWDATLPGCIRGVVENPDISREHAVRLLSGNALAFYGPRLARRVRPADAGRKAS